MLTFMGRWVLWPPYILRPTTRFAYCTGRRRSESLIRTMSTIMASAPRSISAVTQTGVVPFAALLIIL